MVVQDHWSSRGREGNDTKSKNLHIYLIIYLFIYLFIYFYIFIYLYIYLFIYLFMLHILFINNLLAYILPCWFFCMLCFRGRAVANVGRTCSPTPLYVLTMYRGNKICLYYTHLVSSLYYVYLYLWLIPILVSRARLWF